MTTPMDLILLPLHRQDGQDSVDMPGLYAATPPRRAARPRSQERLVIQLDLEGTAPLSSKGYAWVMRQLTSVYFKTRGSVTAAMRAVAEWLNVNLRERNIRGARRGMQSVGLLTLVVVRQDRLYVGQAGPTHAFLITSDGVRHLYDPALAGQGLGVGKATTMRYHQMRITSGDALLIAPKPASSWQQSNLASLHGLSLGNYHRRLVQGTEPDFKAALMMLQAGQGEVRVLHPKSVLTGEGRELEGEPAPLGTPEGEDHAAASVSAVDVPLGEPRQEENMPSLREQTVIREKQEPEYTPPSRQRVVGPALLTVGRVLSRASRQAGKKALELGQRMLPDENLFSIPSSWMAFIAIAVPLLVVTVSAGVYLERGRGRLFEEYYLQAQRTAELARSLEDPSDVRAAWQNVLAYLDQAEVYQSAEASQRLRQEAMGVLDELDGVQRLVFQQAVIRGLPADIQIKRIVVRDDDGVLYLLNEVDGSVLRAVRVGQMYEVDENFICQPVPGPIIVDKLVDIIASPPNDPNNVAVMGIDSNGNLMSCIPGGEAPLTIPLFPPPIHWGSPTRLVMDLPTFYVLDPVTNAVWFYMSAEKFDESPILFFDEDIPPISDVVDFTVYKGELFLLHEDGHLTTCVFVRGVPTRCTDPATFQDPRPGRESGPMMGDAVFQAVQFAPPPDPSLYFLDPQIPAVYHLSLRLNFQGQYRPLEPLPEGPVTAFAVSSGDYLYLAIGGQVYFAPLH